MIIDDEHIGNFSLALSTFFMWLMTQFQNHYVGFMGGVVLLFTALNQYRSWRNRVLIKKKLEIEIKRLEKNN